MRSMSPRTTRGRHNRRRALAAVSTAAALIGVLQVSGAAPAQADNCGLDTVGNYVCTIYGGDPDPIPDPGFPDPIGTLEPTPDPGGDPGTPDPDPSREIGFQLATAFLTNPDCNSLVTGSSSESADHVWLYVAKHESSSPYPDDPNALAASPVGAGSGGSITIYPPYHTVTYSPAWFPALSPNQLVRTPTDDEMRALALLHEVAHLTGTLGQHVPGDNGYAFNQFILDRCLKLVKH